VSKFGICMFQPRPESSSIVALEGESRWPVEPASNDCVEGCRAFLKIYEGGKMTGHACALAMGCTALANIEMTLRNIAAAIVPQEKPLAQPSAIPQ
jgi:hypothetical protein